MQTGSAPVIERHLRLLVVDATCADAELAMSYLKRAGYTLSFDIVHLLESFVEKLQQSKYDVIVSDHNLGTWTGLDALEILRQSGRDIPFILVTGTLGDEAAVAYLKRGAADYILKHRLNVLPLAVGHALKEKTHRDERAQLQERIAAGTSEWEIAF